MSSCAPPLHGQPLPFHRPAPLTQQHQRPPRQPPPPDIAATASGISDLHVNWKNWMQTALLGRRLIVILNVVAAAAAAAVPAAAPAAATNVAAPSAAAPAAKLLRPPSNPAAAPESCCCHRIPLLPPNPAAFPAAVAPADTPAAAKTTSADNMRTRASSPISQLTSPWQQEKRMALLDCRHSFETFSEIEVTSAFLIVNYF